MRTVFIVPVLLASFALGCIGSAPAAFAGQWQAAFPAYKLCIDRYAGPRIRDIAAQGIPITEGRITVVVEDAESSCKAEAIALKVALRADSPDAPEMSDGEFRRRLRVLMVVIFLADQMDGNRCYGMHQQYCY